MGIISTLEGGLVAKKKSKLDRTPDEQKWNIELDRMFHALKVAHENGVAKRLLRHEGFDANNDYERKFLRIMEQLINSPRRMIPIYERMLVEWRKSTDRANLTAEDFARIAKARDNPE